MKLSHKILIFALMAAGSSFPAFAWNQDHVDALEKTGSCTTWCDLQKKDMRELVKSLNVRGLVLDVRGSNLEDANLQGSDLKKANLQDTNLTGAYLDGANLTEANLAGANLSNATASEATFDRAQLTGAILKLNAPFATFVGAIFNSKTTITGSSFAWANFSDSNIHTATIDAYSDFGKALMAIKKSRSEAHEMPDAAYKDAIITDTLMGNVYSWPYHAPTSLMPLDIYNKDKETAFKNFEEQIKPWLWFRSQLPESNNALRRLKEKRNSQ
ncbi:MAG: pentapeptide repeat-containing protein [Candidatus Babeliaceae bacterium]|jgi:uncharacterized protein YjbI with pentapeptide repeats